MTEPRSRLDDALNDQAQAPQWYRSPLVIGAGLLVVFGLIALVALSGGDDAAEESDSVEAASITFGGVGIPEIDAVTIDGDPLPPFDPNAADPAVGTLMPAVTATSLANGSPITLGPGRARVIGFFAHWCPHCQAELPEITQWPTSVDETRGNYPPSGWFTDVGFNSPVLVDDADTSLLNGLGFGGFPAFVAVDASGVIVARAGGNIGTPGLEALFANFAS